MFFSDTTLKTRRFRPKISPADARRLKDVLSEGILSQSQFEQVILYFLADKKFRNLSPSIATMLSSTVLNGLINCLMNRAQFYKELDGHRAMFLTERKETNIEGIDTLSEKLKKLREKMSVKRTDAKDDGMVGLFRVIH